VSVSLLAVVVDCRDRLRKAEFWAQAGAAVQGLSALWSEPDGVGSGCQLTRLTILEDPSHVRHAEAVAADRALSQRL